MNVSCNNCPAKYAIPDHKVRGRRVRITCKHCGATIIVDGQTLDNATVGAPATSPAAPSPAEPAQTVKSATSEPASSAAPAQANPAPATAPRPDPARPAQAVALKPGASAASSGETQRPPVAPAESKQSVAAQRKIAPKRAEPEWTVAITDDHHEEMDTPEIVALYAAGTIGAETFVWKDGMKDWLMPFEIPEIARALEARGIAPPREEPEPEPKSFGVWREPGSWNEPPRAPGAEDDDVDFNDVTVAMAAPQAEELLRAAEQNAPGSTRYAQDDDEDATVIRPGLSDDDTSDEDATTIMASPFSAESMLLGTELAPPEPPPEPAPRSRLPSIAGDGHLTGERNESSVLFSLEAMAKSASPKPEKHAEPEDLFRAEPAPVAEEARARAALGSLADEQLLNAFTMAAQPEEAPPPPPPPPPSVAAPTPPRPRVEPAQPPPAARGWLWLLLIVVALAGVAAAAVILKIPRALFTNASASPPQPSAPSAATAEPAPALAAPSASATPNSSATASASPSAGAKPAASALHRHWPPAATRPQGTAPTHTTAKFFAPHATAPGAHSAHAAPPAGAASTASSGVKAPTPVKTAP